MLDTDDKFKILRNIMRTESELIQLLTTSSKFKTKNLDALINKINAFKIDPSQMYDSGGEF